MGSWWTAYLVRLFFSLRQTSNTCVPFALVDIQQSPVYSFGYNCSIKSLVSCFIRVYAEYLQVLQKNPLLFLLHKSTRMLSNKAAQGQANRHTLALKHLGQALSALHKHN
jgi:hypothetical protein